MARIDYSNVSISLQQFEAVASGKYNAGEVKLAGQHTLDRVNNHVHFTRFNNVVISHAEVVAIKNAFVRALSEGGLSDEASQKEDDEEIGAAIRMAILLLTTAGRIGSASRMEVSCDDRGTTYAVFAADGELEDSGTDWAPLVKRFETELGDAPESLSIIWP